MFIQQTMKKIAYGVLVCFCATLFPDFSYALAQQEQIASHTFLPSDIGKVIERYTGNTNRNVYVIQTIHCHPETQTKISTIIDAIKKRHGNDVALVGVEGSVGRIDTSLIGTIANRRVKDAVRNYFLERGYLTGAEVYDIEHPRNVQLYGMEDEELYRENFAMLYAMMEARDKVEKMVAEERRVIQRGRVVLYVPALQSFAQEEKAYREGLIRTEMFVDVLKGKTRVYDVDVNHRYPMIETVCEMQRLHKRINQRAVRIEAQQCVARLKRVLKKKDYALLKKQEQNTEELYRVLGMLVEKARVGIQKYVQLGLYLKYLGYKDQLNEIRLNEEIEEMTYRVKEAMVRGITDTALLVKGERYLDVFERVVRNEASERDVQWWNAHKAEWHDVLRRLHEKLDWKEGMQNEEKRKQLTINNDTMNNKGKELLKMQNEESKKLRMHVLHLDDIETMATGFYEKAEKRNEVMVKNLLQQKGKVLIAVVGGYHAQGIGAVLRGKGISYEMIMPVTTMPYNSHMYEQRIKEQAQWMSSKMNFFSGNMSRTFFHTSCVHVLEPTSIFLIRKEMIRQEYKRLELCVLLDRDRVLKTLRKRKKKSFRHTINTCSREIQRCRALITCILRFNPRALHSYVTTLTGELREPDRNERREVVQRTDATGISMLHLANLKTKHHDIVGELLQLADWRTMSREDRVLIVDTEIGILRDTDAEYNVKIKIIEGFEHIYPLLDHDEQIRIQEELERIVKEDNEGAVCGSAAKGLGIIGATISVWEEQREIVSFLVISFKHNNSATQTGALKGLTALVKCHDRNRCIRHVLQFMQHKNRCVREWVAQFFSEIDMHDLSAELRREVRDALLQRVIDAHADVRQCAHDALNTLWGNLSRRMRRAGIERIIISIEEVRQRPDAEEIIGELDTIVRRHKKDFSRSIGLRRRVKKIRERMPKKQPVTIILSGKRASSRGHERTLESSEIQRAFDLADTILFSDSAAERDTAIQELVTLSNYPHAYVRCEAARELFTAWSSDRILDEQKQRIANRLFDAMKTDASERVRDYITSNITSLDSDSNNRARLFSHLIERFNDDLKDRVRRVAGENIRGMIHALQDDIAAIDEDTIASLSALRDNATDRETVEQTVLFLLSVLSNSTDSVIQDATQGAVLRISETIPDVVLRANIVEKCTRGNMSHNGQRERDTVQQCIADATNAYLDHNYEQALKALEEANGVAGNAHVDVSRGEVYEAWGKVEDAVRCFDEAITHDPKCTEAYFHIGKIRYEQKKYHDGLDMFDKVLEIHYTHSRALYYQGLCYEALQQYDVAIDAYTEIVDSMYPFHEQALERRRRLYYEEERYRESREDVDRLRRIHLRYRDDFRRSYAVMGMDRKNGYHPMAQQLSDLYQYVEQINFSADTLLVATEFSSVEKRLGRIFGREKVAHYMQEANYAEFKAKALQSRYGHERRKCLFDFCRFCIMKDVEEEYYAYYELFHAQSEEARSLERQIHFSGMHILAGYEDTEIAIAAFNNTLRGTCCEICTAYDFVQKYFATDTLFKGFGLGISSDLVSTYSAWISMLGLVSWEAAYGFFHIVWTVGDSQTDTFLTKITDTGRKIVFFVPQGIDRMQQDAVTRKEIAWILDMLTRDPARIRNIIFVFGLYDLLPIQVCQPVGVPSSQEGILRYILNYVLQYERNSEDIQRMITRAHECVKQEEEKGKLVGDIDTTIKDWCSMNTRFGNAVESELRKDFLDTLMPSFLSGKQSEMSVLWYLRERINRENLTGSTLVSADEPGKIILENTVLIQILTRILSFMDVFSHAHISLIRGITKKIQSLMGFITASGMNMHPSVPSLREQPQDVEDTVQKVSAVGLTGWALTLIQHTWRMHRARYEHTLKMLLRSWRWAAQRAIDAIRHPIHIHIPPEYCGQMVGEGGTHTSTAIQVYHPVSSHVALRGNALVLFLFRSNLIAFSSAILILLLQRLHGIHEVVADVEQRVHAQGWEIEYEDYEQLVGANSIRPIDEAHIWTEHRIDGKTYVCVTKKMVEILTVLHRVIPRDRYELIMDEIMKHETLEYAYVFKDGMATEAAHTKALAQAHPELHEFLALLPLCEQLLDVQSLRERETLAEMWSTIHDARGSIARLNGSDVSGLELLNAFPNLVNALERGESERGIVAREVNAGELFTTYADEVAQFRKEAEGRQACGGDLIAESGQREEISREEMILFSDGIVLWQRFQREEIVDRRIIEGPVGEEKESSEMKWVQQDIRKGVRGLAGAEEVSRAIRAVGEIIATVMSRRNVGAYCNTPALIEAYDARMVRMMMHVA